VDEAQPACGQAQVNTQVTAHRFAVLSPMTASVLGAVVLALAAASIPLAGLVHQLTFPVEGAVAVPALACAAVGMVVGRHQPGNPLGWLLLFFALLLMLSVDGGYYAVFCYRLGHQGLWLAPVAVLLVPLWAPASALFSLVILLFPDGRLAWRRWRWVLWAYAGLVACYLVFSYAGTIAAVAGHHIRLDSAGDVSSVQHQPGWLSVLVLVPITVIWLSFAAHQVLSWRRASAVSS
jgi:hypothetical protein